MAKIELEKHAREAMVQALGRYLKTELELEVTPFDAQFLLDFISERLGPYYYNQALADAQAQLVQKLDVVTEAIGELEKAVRA